MNHFKVPYRFIIILISLFIFQTFNSYASDIETTDEQADEIVRTIDEINTIRAIYGLPLLEYNSPLNETAEKHNLYMEMNNLYSSIEESGNVYFRGRYPWDRALNNDYDKSYVFELINKDISNYSSGLNQLIQNPYARYGILDPLYTDIGMDIYKGYSTYLLGGSGRVDNYEVIYPYDKQTNVDTEYNNKYVIDPYSNLSETYDAVGIPVTYSFYSSNASVEEFSNTYVSIRNVSTNELIDVEVVTSENDRNSNNTIMILPTETYDYGTTYQVKIRSDIVFDRYMSIDGQWTNSYSINYTTTFTTNSSGYTFNQQSYVTRAKFVEGLIKTLDFSIRDSVRIIFPDVDVTSSSYKYIYTAYVNNLVKGYSDSLFRPNANINREQVYTIIIRAYEKQIGTIWLNDSNRELVYLDIDNISSYALDPLYKAKKIGLINDDTSYFNPKAYITTTEFNQILRRLNIIMK